MADKESILDREQSDEGPFIQFEECDKKECIYYDESGKCCYETCRTVLENPMSAPVSIKKCQCCRENFAVDMNEMKVQHCPACLDGMYKAEGHPHKCIFCGKSLDSNPSIFWPVCPSCFENITYVALGSHSCVEQACNSAHCYSCC